MGAVKKIRKIGSAIISLVSYGILPSILIQQLAKGITIQGTLIRVIIPANIVGMLLISIAIAFFSLIEIKDPVINSALLSTKYFLIILYEISWFTWISRLVVYVKGSIINFEIYTSAYGGLILIGTILTWIFKYLNVITKKPEMAKKTG